MTRRFLTVMTIFAAAIAFGVGPADAGAASSCPASTGGASDMWLGGAVHPLTIAPVSGKATADDAATMQVIDKRLAEAEQLVRQHPLDPPRAARAYTVSMLAAREALRNLPQSLRPQRDVAVDRAFFAAAKARGIYAPQASTEVAALEAPATIEEALAMAFGAVSARRVVAAVADDGSDTASQAKVEWDTDPKRATKSGTWVPTAPGFLPPLQPGWGKVAGIGIDPLGVREDLKPPVWTSPSMEAERQGFLELQHHIDPKLVDIAHDWNDGSGTSTPAGTWLSRANDDTKTLSPSDRLEVLAATSVATHDAFVLTWDRKFHYMSARPIQWMKGKAWKKWKPWIPTPPFPSWPSGHAVVSAAAAGVIGEMVPAKATVERAAAQEAADSRVWAGIHWPSDSKDGTVLGLALADELAKSATCA